jgi:hypothetical protein
MEELGASVGIVMDESEEDIENVVMSDDGTGAGIRTPSMLISKKDGTKLIEYLESVNASKLAEVSIMAKFEMGRPDNRVEYDIWYSVTDQKMLDFLLDF